MTETAYERQREDYWAAQSALRHAAIEEMRRRLPATAQRVILAVSDSRCLVVIRVLDAEGHSILDFTAADGDDPDLYDSLDEIAGDMEVVSPDEAKLFLPRTEGGDFYIDREATEATTEAGNVSGGTTLPAASAEAPTEAQRLRSLVHEARNILWSSGNGGYAGGTVKVKRILTSICDEAEQLWGVL